MGGQQVRVRGILQNATQNFGFVGAGDKKYHIRSRIQYRECQCDPVDEGRGRRPMYHSGSPTVLLVDRGRAREK
jgi:hypothetical protein